MALKKKWNQRRNALPGLQLQKAWQVVGEMFSCNKLDTVLFFLQLILHSKFYCRVVGQGSFKSFFPET